MSGQAFVTGRQSTKIEQQQPFDPLIIAKEREREKEREKIRNKEA